MATVSCVTAKAKSVLKDALESLLLKCPAHDAWGMALVPHAAALV
jgi:hypothetical protein